MSLNFMTPIFSEASGREALVWNNRSFTYDCLSRKVAHWSSFLHSKQVKPGTVVMLVGDFSPNSIAILFALIEQHCIIIPIVRGRNNATDEFAEIGMAQVVMHINEKDDVELSYRHCSSEHSLFRLLREANHPGLMLFTSGSTGRSKAVVHDFAKFLRKYHVRRQDLRTLAFLLFDHIGGLDTLFYCLSNGSALIIPEDRSTDKVCHAVETHRIEVLPVSPSFLNLVFLTQAHLRYDLSSLKYITYGAEVMPQETLRRCAEAFPRVRLLQKYGTTEIGTLRSRSDDPASIWVKIGGEGYEWRVVDGILQVKADSAMLGYLNAPHPFTSDGWFITGDCVEVDGENLKILGRKSDIINVAGQKVYPAEVEDVICQMDNVADAIVYGERNPFMGNIVCTKVKLIHNESLDQFVLRLRQHCRDRMDKYKIPLKITISDEFQTDVRSKKLRHQLSSSGGNANG
jgi:long-chain acyl-CoA synthetase